MNSFGYRFCCRFGRLVGASILAIQLLHVPAKAQVAPLTARPVEVELSSGAIDNPGGATVAFSVDVDMGPDALWVRVRFAETTLPEGSAVKITSLLDGASQTLNARHLADWQGTSGYFNGPAVRLELLAGAGTFGNSIRVDDFIIGLAPARDFSPEKSICGDTDERTPSSDAAVARIPASGCTAFLVDCPDVESPDGFCFLSAGHCFAGELSTVIQFDVPSSEADCTPRHPPFDEQFAIDPDSLVVIDGGPGDDWALFRTFLNPESGLTAFGEQLTSYTIAEATPTQGMVQVTGFGVDAHGDAIGGGITACEVCDPETSRGSRNSTQQTHFGDIFDLADGALTYRADTCAGNSGSPVVSMDTGEVVAIHTHTGCAMAANLGTALTGERLRQALALRGDLALAKNGTLHTGGDGIATPGDAVTYTFTISNPGGVAVTGITIDDPMVPVIDCPDGQPIPRLDAGASVTCTGAVILTQQDVDAGVKINTAAVVGTGPFGTRVRAEDSHSLNLPSDPDDPDPPNPPDPPGTQSFACTSDGFLVHGENAQLTRVDQSSDPADLVPIGDPAGIEINSLGFRSTDGFLYGVELHPSGNNGIIRIDRDGNIVNLGRPSGFPPAPRFEAGDVTPDGTAMFITVTTRPLYRLDLTQLPNLPPVTHVVIHGAGGAVSDWAISPIDGMLYGGDSAQGQVAMARPSDGFRVDFDVSGLPNGSPFGGAWFNAAGRLFLYRNSGTIYEIDLQGSDGPTIVTTRSAPAVSRNDGAACAAAVVSGPGIDLVKSGELDLGDDGLATPGDIVNYTFRIANIGDETLTQITVDDPLVASIDCPGGQPISSMAPGAVQICSGQATLTQADIDAGVKINTATVSALTEGGQTVNDQDSHSQDIPTPGDGPDPFACTGEAYIIQDQNAQLTLVDQTVDPFDFINIGGPTGIEINNMGFRETDGLLYGVELSATGNVQIVRIDSEGNVDGLGRPAGLPASPRFDAGDVTPDGSAMYITTSGQPLYRVDLTSVPALPAVTSVTITGATGFVFDWTVSPIDGRLYGGDSSQGQLAVLDPATGVRTDFGISGLPAGAAYGGAWFDASGHLFLYQNSGAIFEIDIDALQIVDMQSGPSSSRNDGAACIESAGLESDGVESDGAELDGAELDGAEQNVGELRYVLKE